MTSVMIVEDNEQMRRLVRALVADVAGPIYECADGAQALACYEASQPDCVLMDIELPGIDGITATSEITRAFPQARVIIVTEYSSDRLREKARLAGASGYILKDNLRDVLNALSVPGQG